MADTAASRRPLTCRKHSPATARIQARLERWELEHLRDLAARQAEEIEGLQRSLRWAEDAAEMWQRSYETLSEHFDNDTADARAIGLTVTGELLVVRTGSLREKTVILSAPAGWGKSLQAEQLRAEFGCSHVVDPWELTPLQQGALHLTNAPPSDERLQVAATAAGALVVSRGWAI